MIRIAIFGGCFIEQHNIEPNRLYHRSLIKMLEEKGIVAEIKTVRYEQILKCPGRISNLFKDEKFDYLIFHLRAEPVMRLVKLYYKYLNKNGNLRHSINFSIMRKFKSEDCDFLAHRHVNFHDINASANEKIYYHFLREINYFLGCMIGNKRYSFKILEKTVCQIKDICNNNNVRLLLLGPVSRPFSRFENNLSENINKKMSLWAKNNQVDYLNLIKLKTEKNESMFFENGMHVSQAGHDEIAMRIFKEILK